MQKQTLTIKRSGRSTMPTDATSWPNNSPNARECSQAWTLITNAPRAQNRLPPMTARNKLLNFLSTNPDMLTPSQAARVDAMREQKAQSGALGVGGGSGEAVGELKRLLRFCGERPGGAVCSEYMEGAAAARHAIRAEIRARLRLLHPNTVHEPQARQKTPDESTL
jgi:hypothetical protein